MNMDCGSRKYWNIIRKNEYPLSCLLTVLPCSFLLSLKRAAQKPVGCPKNSIFSSFQRVRNMQLLTVKEGEVFMIEAMGTYSGYQTFFIEYSADKTNWTKSATAITLGSDWATYSVSDIPAGKYYIAIHASQARVRNFYGGELPMEAKMKVTQPESLDFGIVDATATKTFTIANTGRAELTGISVASSGETFTIAGAPTTLAAGESAEVSINMSAAATGVFSSTITVSAEGQESVTFDVTGIVLPEGLSVIDFNDNKLPNGWELTSSNKWSFSDGKAYATSAADMVTSELELSQGDMIVIKASSYDNYDNNYLTISGSADGGATWTAYSKKFVSRSQIPYGSYATLVINDVPATVNKLKFTGYYVRVDEIDGLTFNQNAPVMSLDNTTAAFGTVKAQPEDKQFTVTNSGTGTLSVAIASDSEDFTVAPATLEDIAAGESKTFTVHFNFAEPWGEKIANITVTPSYDPTAAVTIAASATSKDPNVWEEDFEAGIPSEWTNSGWTISRKWSEESSVNHAYSGSSNSNTLVTPRLFATEGAVLEFEVIDAEENYPLTVEYSSDMQNWTEYGKITESGTATFTAPAEGAYYLRFSGRYIYLDNFSGFKLDLPAADAVITASTLPATGNQFVAYNASVTVENKGTEAQVAVAKLLVNGEEKYSQEAELAVAASATIDLSFVPEEAITDGTATIEVTLKDVEDFAAKTVEATINIAAAPVIDETAENSFTTGILPVAVLNYTAIHHLCRGCTAGGKLQAREPQHQFGYRERRRERRTRLPFYLRSHCRRTADRMVGRYQPGTHTACRQRSIAEGSARLLLHERRGSRHQPQRGSHRLHQPRRHGDGYQLGKGSAQGRRQHIRPQRTQAHRQPEAGCLHSEW